MLQKFEIEIISPNKIIYKDSTTETILPCFEGQVTILKDHISFITFLRPGIIEVDNKEKFYVEEGTIEFFNNKLLVLSATAQNLKDLNNKSIIDMIKKAEENLIDNQISDKQKYILNYKVETLKQIN
tara:strand:+ start:1017 stop:1397 length:381 start_codon:yes stop_codon:yes gene_type:complete